MLNQIYNWLGINKANTLSLLNLFKSNKLPLCIFRILILSQSNWTNLISTFLNASISISSFPPSDSDLILLSVPFSCEKNIDLSSSFSLTFYKLILTWLESRDSFNFNA